LAWSDLTTDGATRIEVPEKLRPYLAEGKLAVVVADETNPTAKRISTEMTWRERNGRATAPVHLTSWVFPNEDSKP